MGVSSVIMRKQVLTVIEMFLNAAQMNLNIWSIQSIFKVFLFLVDSSRKGEEGPCILGDRVH